MIFEEDGLSFENLLNKCEWHNKWLSSLKDINPELKHLQQVPSGKSPIMQSCHSVRYWSMSWARHQRIKQPKEVGFI